MMMRKKQLSIWGLFCIVLLVLPFHISASETDKTIIIYSYEEEESLREIRILDSVIGQFTQDFLVIADTEVKKEDLLDVSHLIYVGADKIKIPENTLEAIGGFNGKFFAVGHNIEQLKGHFTWINVDDEVLSGYVEIPNNDYTITLSEERIIYQLADGTYSTIANTYNDTNSSEKFPLIAYHENEYYFTGQSLFSPFGEVLAEGLYHFYSNKEASHIRYLRLEDVHPLMDAKVLREQAEYLKEKNIPYMVAVIPVYTDGDRTIHFSDSKELTETLRYMQKNGASILLHGYRHQYRSSETGEGFEFWDVENNRPIYQAADEPAKLLEDFPSKEAYEQFVKAGEAFEAAYIEDAVLKGVQELVAHRIYPLAFEAPHYTMSQNGYQILSQYFTTYVGRLQLTDLFWESSYSPLYKSTPAFLHGMTVHPETIGFIEAEVEDSLQQMQANIEVLQHFNQVYIAGFYHPYLGLEGLKEVVESLESIPNASWLDLKAEDNKVEINDIRIESKDGEIEVSKPFFASTYERKVFFDENLIYFGLAGIILIILISSIVVKIRKRTKVNR